MPNYGKLMIRHHTNKPCLTDLYGIPELLEDDILNLHKTSIFF